MAIALDALRRERNALVARRVGRQRKPYCVSTKCREAPAHGRCRRIGLAKLGERFAVRHPRLGTLDHVGEGLTVDQVQRIDDVALHFAHLLARLVDDEAVKQDASEGDLPGEMDAEHHHSSDPKKENVVARLEVARWVKLGKGRRRLGPTEGRERPERTREPCIEYVGVLSPGVLWPFVAEPFGTLARDSDFAIRAVPRRNLVTPP